MKFLLCFSFLFLLLISCTNIFNPKGEQTVINENLDSLTERSDIMAYADSMMLLGDYSNAVMAYDKLIAQNRYDGEARLFASMAVLKRDQLQITNAVFNIIDASKAGSNFFTIFINELNVNPIFREDSALQLVQNYLNDPTCSLFYGDCDDSVSVDSIELSYNLLLTTILMMPASIYDSDGDFHYNETNEYPENGGDFLIYLSDSFPLEVNYDYAILTNNIDNARTVMESNFFQLTNNFNTNIDFLAMDNVIKIIHDDTIEFTLEQMYNIDIYGNVKIIDDCINRLVDVMSNLSFMQDLTNSYQTARDDMFTNAGIVMASNFLSGLPLNSAHVELCGQLAFDTVRGIGSWVYTPWPDFYSATADSSNIQGQLKIMYENYQTLVELTTNVSAFSNYFTNDFFDSMNAFYSNFDALSNNFTNFL